MFLPLASFVLLLMDWIKAAPGRLYVVAMFLPLASFALLLLAGGVRALCRPSRQAPGIPSTLYWLFGGDRPLKSGAYFATGCMAAAAAIAITGLVLFLQDSEKHLKPEAMAARWSERMDWVRIGSQNSAAPADWEKRTEADPDRTPPRTALALELGYKIDHLSALMFAMVTVIGTGIFLFSLGYMKAETDETVHDHEVDHQSPPKPLGGSIITSIGAAGTAGSFSSCRCSASRCSTS